MPITPYLSFKGQAREALDFYQGIFGGDVETYPYGDAAAPGVTADDLMHASLKAPHDINIMMADIGDGFPCETTNTTQMSVSAPDGDLVRSWFAKLADGGEIKMPLEKQFWGDEFGMLVDKFGVPWQVNLGE